ncbi:S8 family peptidase [Mucilaginibacter angelicae]|uniref:S8 family peptidase n=1 Tax=Mucilaginibacter angelicae TaxID=869718 RepID=A0ABV6L9U2_9SPHI
MTKRIPLTILLLFLCFKASWSQKHMSDAAISSIYKASPSVLQNTTPGQYYLVKFKDPAHIDNRKYNITKRISYEYYIISPSPAIKTDNNIISAGVATPLWKASDNLAKNWKQHPGRTQAIEVTFTAINDTVINHIKKFGTIISQTSNLTRLNIKLEDLPGLLQQDYILFAGEVRQPHEELAISDIDLGLNTMSAIRANFPDITGFGINVSVKEDRYDNDLDLLGRSFISFKTSDITSGHATTMATLIGGNGNSYIKGLGTAPKVKFTSSSFAQLMPDSSAIFKSFNISVQNHSYGTGIENYYGAESAAYDQQIFENDSLVHVFSSGNIGTSAPESGVYNGISGVANLSGDFKQAKNVLVVGGTGRTGDPESLSSAGPTYDGRIKPELIADGEDGTSGAAALVSGTVALLQQAYKTQYKQLPSAALIKSVLINSANEINPQGPGHKTGYGSLNALEALRTINEKRFIAGSVINAGQTDYPMTVPLNCAEFKVSLAWNDPAASINAASALVNDLDLTVTTPSGQQLLPWVLSGFPSPDSLSAPAKRRVDTLNNAEQVSLQNPVAGTYIVHVKGSRVTAGTQKFYLSHQETIANRFEWTYPSAGDQLFAGEDNYLRWQSSFSTISGQISISFDHGLTWQALSNATLKNRYYTWAAPAVFTKAILKMNIGSQTFTSGEFSISKPLTLDVGYNCSSGTLLQWNPQPGSTGYTVYTIKDNLLQKFASTADTSIIIPAQQQTSTYFAVSAAGSGFEGIKSYTIDATTQGVGCYVKTLLANVVNNTVLLNLQLGSVYNLKSITWEKTTPAGQYVTLNTMPVSTSLSYQYTDNNPRQGKQYYRARLTTTNGDTIYSNIADAVYLQPNQFVIYPNPVAGQINILSGDINNYEFKLYGTDGRLNMAKSINELQNTFPVKLVAGVYVYTIELNGKVVYNGKLIKI